MHFIHFGPTHAILAHLDEAERNGNLLTIFGEEATGKTRLAHHWKDTHTLPERQAGAELRPCIYVDLFRTQRTMLNRGTYVTPITNVLFNEILYQMGQLPWIYAKEIVSSRWYQPTGTLSSDSAFLALFNCVRRYYSRLSARMLIIDGAELLDAPSFDMLMRLRSVQRTPTGIAFCIQLEKNEHFSNAVDSFERKIPHGYRSLFHRRNALTLPRLEPREFVEIVLKALFEQLRVDTTEETDAAKTRKAQISRRCWQQTQGDWVSIRGLYEDMSIALGEKRGKQRQLTSEMLRKVFPDWEETTI